MSSRRTGTCHLSSGQLRLLDRCMLRHLQLVLLALNAEGAMRSHLMVPVLLNLVRLLLLNDPLLLLVYLRSGGVDIGPRLGLVDVRGVRWGMLDVRYG